MIKRLNNFRRRFFLTPKEVRAHEDSIFKMKAEFDERLAVLHRVESKPFSDGKILCSFSFYREIFWGLTNDREYMIYNLTNRMRDQINTALDRPAPKK